MSLYLPRLTNYITMPLILMSHPTYASSVRHRFLLPPHKSLSISTPFSRNLRFHGSRFSTSKQPTRIAPSVSPEKYEASIAISDGEAPQFSMSNVADVVRNFYGGINCHDIDAVENLIADNCVYEDLVFPQPFVGRKAILDFFKRFTESCSTDLQFVIDDISEADQSAVGVTWHLEWKGKPFPFSKGCSFYRLEVSNGLRQIIYARDSVEPAIKPGESTLTAAYALSDLVRSSWIFATGQFLTIFMSGILAVVLCLF